MCENKDDELYRFDLSSPECVACDGAAAGDRAKADVGQVLAVQVPAAGRRRRVLDEHRVGASLQHRVQSVRLARRSVEPRLGPRVVVQTLDLLRSRLCVVTTVVTTDSNYGPVSPTVLKLNTNTPV